MVTLAISPRRALIKTADRSPSPSVHEAQVGRPGFCNGDFLSEIANTSLVFQKGNFRALTGADRGDGLQEIFVDPGFQLVDFMVRCLHLGQTFGGRPSLTSVQRWQNRGDRSGVHRRKIRSNLIDPAADPDTASFQACDAGRNPGWEQVSRYPCAGCKCLTSDRKQSPRTPVRRLGILWKVERQLPDKKDFFCTSLIGALPYCHQRQDGILGRGRGIARPEPAWSLGRNYTQSTHHKIQATQLMHD